MATDRLFLRPPVNVPDALERDEIVRRIAALRKTAVRWKARIEQWNRGHPEEEAIGAEFYDQVIAWCDGEGLFPTPEETDEH